MIDCGEGAQMQLRRSRLKFSRLNHIFISHLHGDHCFGLMGLISTFGLLGRTAKLHIYAPAPLDQLLQPQLDYYCAGMDYQVEVHTIDTTRFAPVYEDRSVTVYTLPLRHRIACCGFLFREKPTLPHIIREKIDFYQVPEYAINQIKNGADWTTPDGKVIPNRYFTRPSEPARSYAYCSDTCYLPELQEHLKNVDLLFHEATFGKDLEKRAQETFHTTAEQAATLARDSQAGRLCIGHFSARYEDETPLLHEAREIFPNTILARENLTLKL